MRFPRINFVRDRGRYCITITSNLDKAEIPRARNLNLQIKEIFTEDG